MHLDDGLAVLEGVRLRDPGCREPPLLTNQRETGAEVISHGATEDESARFNAGNDFDPTIDMRLCHGRHRRGECRGIAEQERDVLEDDAGAGKIRNVSDE